MDTPFLVESQAKVEVTGGTEEVKTASLAIIALSGIVNFRLSKHKDLCAESIPFDLPPVCLEERLLTRRRRRECQEAINLHARGLTL